MMASRIHVGHVGLVLKALIVDEDGTAVDVSAASTKQIRLRKPDGTTSDKTASFTTDGSDGYIQYTTIAGDLDTDGTWLAQPYIVSPSKTFRTEFHEFEVYPNLAAP